MVIKIQKKNKIQREDKRKQQKLLSSLVKLFDSQSRESNKPPKKHKLKKKNKSKSL